MNRVANSGWTPQILSSLSGYIGVVALLLYLGAEEDKADHRGQTRVHQASSNVRMAVAELLLDFGVDVNRADYGFLMTPLQQAGWGGHTEVGKLLRLRMGLISMPSPIQGKHHCPR